VDVVGWTAVVVKVATPVVVVLVVVVVEVVGWTRVVRKVTG
jgi:hypothetical protein